jgi:hypothetical protein
MGLNPMTEDNRQRISVDVAAACENELNWQLFKKEAMEKRVVTGGLIKIFLVWVALILIVFS